MIATRKNKNNKRAQSKREVKDKSEDNYGENTPNCISSLQYGELVTGTDGEIYENITCHKRKYKGHYKTSCPNSKQDIGVNVLQINALDEVDQKYDLVFTQVDSELAGIHTRFMGVT